MKTHLLLDQLFIILQLLIPLLLLFILLIHSCFFDQSGNSINFTSFPFLICTKLFKTNEKSTNQSSTFYSLGLATVSFTLILKMCHVHATLTSCHKNRTVI